MEEEPGEQHVRSLVIARRSEHKGTFAFEAPEETLRIVRRAAQIIKTRSEKSIEMLEIDE